MSHHLQSMELLVFACTVPFGPNSNWEPLLNHNRQVIFATKGGGTSEVPGIDDFVCVWLMPKLILLAFNPACCDCFLSVCFTLPQSLISCAKCAQPVMRLKLSTWILPCFMSVLCWLDSSRKRALHVATSTMTCRGQHRRGVLKPVMRNQKRGRDRKVVTWIVLKAEVAMIIFISSGIFSIAFLVRPCYRTCFFFWNKSSRKPTHRSKIGRRNSPKDSLVPGWADLKLHHSCQGRQRMIHV